MAAIADGRVLATVAGAAIGCAGVVIVALAAGRAAAGYVFAAVVVVASAAFLALERAALAAGAHLARATTTMACTTRATVSLDFNPSRFAIVVREWKGAVEKNPPEDLHITK